MFHALNSPSASSSDTDSDEDTSDSGSESNFNDETKKEDSIHEKYRKALEFYSLSNFIEAKQLFEQLINDKVFIDICKTKSTKNAELKQLYFASLKNLAAIYAEENDCYSSVVYYLKAIDICKSDVVVYYRLGAEACKSEQFSLARTAFEEGLKISPDHWMCLDKLIAVLYIVGDYSNCILKIKIALEKNNNYVRGLVLKDEIYYRNPYLAKISKKYFEGLILGKYNEQEGKEILNRLNALADRMMEKSRPKPEPIIKPPIPLESLSWLSLAETLYRVYDEFEKTNISLSSFVDLSDWINSSKKQEIVACSVLVDKLQPEDIDLSLDVSMEAHCDGSEQAVCSSNLLDSTMDSVVSESDNDTKSVAATSTTSGGECGFDENQSQSGVVSNANSDQESAFVLPRRSSTKSARGRKRKTNADSISEAKRRSSRLIPGFFMEDPEAFGPLTTKPISLKDQLCSYLPEKLTSSLANDDPTANNSTTNVTENYSEELEKNCELLDENGADDVLDLLKKLDGSCFIELLWNFVKIFRHCWRQKWSQQFCRAYLNCCKRWTKHVQFVTPLCRSESTEWLREVAEVRILAAELELKFCVDNIKNESTFLTEYLSQMSVFRSTYGPEWTMFGCRVAFYRAKRAEMCKNFDVAKSFLEECLFWLSLFDADNENLVIFLPNCEEKLCKSLIVQKMNGLEKRRLLNSVEKYFDLGEYQSVVDVLSTPNEASCDDGSGFKEKFERSKLLAKCYLKLNDYNLLAYSVVDVLKLCLDVYRRLDFVEKYDWWKNFDEILSWTDVCLQANERIFDDFKLSSLKTLASTLIELILCFVDYSSGNQRQKDCVPVSCWIDTWILLYKICKQLEVENNLNDDNYIKNWYATADSHNVVLATKSLMILHRGHEELGKKGLCMLKEGRLLTTLADELMKSLRHPKVSKYLSSSVNDDTLNCAEQCFYCLYNYPRKRSRCLVEHYAKNISLDWDRAQLVFDFVRPEKSPEFDDQPHNCISAETIHLLHRIETLIPADLKPDQFHVQLEDYIDGRRFDLPSHECFVDAPIVRDLYHLLADSYGKAKDKDLKKVCLYYELDLCISNDRADSWAGLALHKGTIVDQALNSLDLKFDDDGLSHVNNLAQPALFCYRKATSLMPDHVVLMVEHGSLAYAMHSFVRRMLKRTATNDDSSEKIVLLKKIIVDYLTEARTAFETANKIPRTPGFEHKEEWVRYYMLGKIAEKFDEKPSIVLPYYHRAAYFLHMDGAKYPTRVQYNAPNYAFEALEIFYRVHVSALKWLMKKKELDKNELKIIWKYLRMFCRHPFKINGQQTHYQGRPSIVEKKSQSHGSLFIDPDVVETVDDLIGNVELGEIKSPVDLDGEPDVALDLSQTVSENYSDFRRRTRREIIKWCLDAMYICIKRCFHCPHYKSFYWLAKYYLECDEVKDVEKSLRILIGSVDSHIVPLFINLKGQNLFEGIWVIPTDDVSRAGSLAAHLHKIVVLLENILTKLNDYERLCDISLLLTRKPGTAKSKYLKECDRESLASSILNSVEVVLKKEFKKVLGSQKAMENICLTAFNCFADWNRLQDNSPAHRNKWNDLIKWLFVQISGNDCCDLSTALNYFQKMSMKRKEDQRALQMIEKRQYNRDFSLSPNIRNPKTYSKSPLNKHSPSSAPKRDSISSDGEVLILSPDPAKSSSSNEITIIKEVGSVHRPSTSSPATSSPTKKMPSTAAKSESEKESFLKLTYPNKSPLLTSSGIFRPKSGPSVLRQTSPSTVRQKSTVPYLPNATVRQMLASKANQMSRFLSNFTQPTFPPYPHHIHSYRLPSTVSPVRFSNQHNPFVNSDLMNAANLSQFNLTPEQANDAIKQIFLSSSGGQTGQNQTNQNHTYRKQGPTATTDEEGQTKQRHQVAKKSIHHS